MVILEDIVEKKVGSFYQKGKFIDRSNPSDWKEIKYEILETPFYRRAKVTSDTAIITHIEFFPCLGWLAGDYKDLKSEIKESCYEGLLKDKRQPQKGKVSVQYLTVAVHDKTGLNYDRASKIVDTTIAGLQFASAKHIPKNLPTAERNKQLLEKANQEYLRSFAIAGSGTDNDITLELCDKIAGIIHEQLKTIAEEDKNQQYLIDMIDK